MNGVRAQRRVPDARPGSRAGTVATTPGSASSRGARAGRSVKSRSRSERVTASGGTAAPVLVLERVEPSGLVVHGERPRRVVALADPGPRCPIRIATRVARHAPDLGAPLAVSGLAAGTLDPRGGLEPQRDRVDAVALVGGGVVALALEDVAEVRAARRAADLDAASCRGRSSMYSTVSPASGA